MQKIVADGITIHDVTNNNVRYFAHVPIRGIAELQQRISSYPRAGEDGIYIANVFQGQRTIRLEGSLVCQPGDDFLFFRRQMAALQQVNRDTDGKLQQKTFVFTTDDGTDYSITGQVTNMQLPDQYLAYAPWAFDIMCDETYFRGGAASLTLGISQGGGFILPVIVPISFESGTGNSGSAANVGNVPAYPIFTITGSVSNPLIVNQTTGEFIQFNVNLGASDTLVVDMANKTATLNGSSAMQYLVSGSTWWNLDPVYTTVAFFSSGSTDDGSVAINWNYAYAGI